ncbi:MAG: DUF2934 domain-containing protein [Vicinamibacteria bacterium]
MPGTTRKKGKKKKQPSTKTRSAHTKPRRKLEIAAQTRDLESRIRERAYHIFLNRGGASGEALGDWLQAERELAS